MPAPPRRCTQLWFLWLGLSLTMFFFSEDIGNSLQNHSKSSSGWCKPRNRKPQVTPHIVTSPSPHPIVPSFCAMSGDATHSQIYQQQLLKKSNTCLHQWGHNCSPSGFCSYLCRTGHERATVADTLRVKELQWAPGHPHETRAQSELICHVSWRNFN